MPSRGLAANVCGDQVRLAPLEARPAGLTARLRTELTRISRLLSAAVAPHAATRPEEEWVHLVLGQLNVAQTALTLLTKAWM